MSEHPDLPGAELLELARAAIGERLGLCARSPRAGLDPRLSAPGACFVTLVLEGALRGCVGSLEARRSLADDVEANARAAAFDDPRFAPLTRGEFSRVRLEVSVLGPLTPLEAAGESDLLRRLVPGRDGLVVAAAGRRATFLPQVWDSLPAGRDFVDHLRRKAGLEADFWDLEPSFWRYRVHKWREDRA